MSPSTRQRSRMPKQRNNSTWVFVGLVLAIVAAFIVAIVLSQSKSTAAEIGPKVKVSGQPLSAYVGPDKPDTAIGQQVPEVSGHSLSGKSLTIGKPGQPTVYAFLAHWCPHCQAEVPVLVQLHKSKNWPSNVALQGIATATNTLRDNYPPSNWLSNENWPGQVLADDKSGGAGQTFGLTGYPYLVFVDKDGKLAGRTSGEVPQAELQTLVTALSKGKPLPSVATGASSSTSG